MQVLKPPFVFVTANYKILKLYSPIDHPFFTTKHKTLETVPKRPFISPTMKWRNLTIYYQFSFIPWNRIFKKINTRCLFSFSTIIKQNNGHQIPNFVFLFSMKNEIRKVPELWIYHGTKKRTFVLYSFMDIHYSQNGN